MYGDNSFLFLFFFLSLSHQSITNPVLRNDYTLFHGDLITAGWWLNYINKKKKMRSVRSNHLTLDGSPPCTPSVFPGGQTPAALSLACSVSDCLAAVGLLRLWFSPLETRTRRLGKWAAFGRRFAASAANCSFEAAVSHFVDLLWVSVCGVYPHSVRACHSISVLLSTTQRLTGVNCPPPQLLWQQLNYCPPWSPS